LEPAVVFVSMVVCVYRRQYLNERMAQFSFKSHTLSGNQLERWVIFCCSGSFLYLITADEEFVTLMTELIMTRSINSTGHEWIIVFLSYTTLHSIFGSVLLLCMDHTSLSHIFPCSQWLIEQFYNSVLFAACVFDWHVMCRLFCTCYI